MSSAQDPALDKIVSKFGNRVREALLTASDAISNVISTNEQVVMYSSPVESMSHFVKEMDQKGVAGLMNDYHKIENDSCNFVNHTAFTLNMMKNRYSDVYCIDETRVHLTLGDRIGDYIHANYVDFPELENKFICTQGPLQTTLDDFWCMVYQERAKTILMLCRPSEEGKLKCAVYWPEKGGKLQLKTVTVEHIGEEATEFDTLLFKVTLNEPSKGAADEGLIVKQHRWSMWPDRGIPSHENSIVPLKLLEYVRSEKAPCIVHCSAGIGRTGTVIAIEMGIQRINRCRRVDLCEIVKDLRKQRAQCIQTEVQYLYVGRVLVEYVLSRKEKLPDDTRQAAEDFLKEYDLLRKKQVDM
uniref:Protein-tyrosine phosphatase n=1 Tax=Syphacia muris TaxID=451379 RepID=A0A0N5AYB3_9BILA